jgi:hypothetical protein
VGRAEDPVLLGQAGQVVHVLGGFLGDDVDHVVHGDHTQHAPVHVGDGYGQQVVAGHDLGDLLLVRVHLHAHGIGDHQVADQPGRRSRHQAAEGHHAAQGALLVHHVEVEDRLVLVGPGAKRVDRLLRRHLGVERGEIRHHDAAGARLGVELRLLELRPEVVREAVENRLAAFLGDPIDEVQQVVDLEPVQHPRQPVVADGFEDLGEHLRRELAQHPCGPPLPEEQVDDGADLLLGEAREEGSDVRRRHPPEQALGAGGDPARQQASQDSRGDLRSRHAESPAPTAGPSGEGSDGWESTWTARRVLGP